MPRIFITGSTDGLGRFAAGVLMGDGHEVVLHARTCERASVLADLAPDAAGVVIGDLSSAAETRMPALGEDRELVQHVLSGVQAFGVHPGLQVGIPGLAGLAPFRLPLVRPAQVIGSGQPGAVDSRPLELNLAVGGASGSTPVAW